MGSIGSRYSYLSDTSLQGRNVSRYNDQPVAVSLLPVQNVYFHSAEFHELKTVHNFVCSHHYDRHLVLTND